MLTAFMMITCDRASLASVGPALAQIKGVSEVYTTTGSVDYIAIVRVKDMESLAALVTGHLRAVPGIVRTDTHLAMRSYSPGDIDAAFQIGVD
jgi:DNA-binding Lrp family transcriptional regulator